MQWFLQFRLALHTLPVVTGILQVGSMLIGLAGFVHIIVKGLLQMSCMLCMSVLFYNHLGVVPLASSCPFSSGCTCHQHTDSTTLFVDGLLAVSCLHLQLGPFWVATSY